MKKNLIILALLLVITKLYGQEYYVIDFVGENATIESIYVENLTQGTSVELEGTDVLHLLLEPVGVNNMKLGSKSLNIFPNPMEQASNIEFFNAKQGNVNIELYNITGKQIYSYSNILSKGKHSFSLTGVAIGSYIVSVKTEMDFLTGKFVSLKQTESFPVLNHKIGAISSSMTEKNEFSEPILRNIFVYKENKSIVEMNYNIGDQMKFTAQAEGCFNSIIYDSPTDDKTYTLNFILKAGQCDGITQFTDPRDGNVYNTIGIGNQCWMAENLKYLPEVHGSVEGWGSYTVYDYIDSANDVVAAKATENYNIYGVLYNWDTAMNGAESSEENPSGVQGICPTGWHLPSDTEWLQLKNYLIDNEYNYDGTTEENKIAKSLAAISYWDASSTEGAIGNNMSENNSSGFNALPGGSKYYYGDFNFINKDGYWWSATDASPSYGYPYLYKLSNDSYQLKRFDVLVWGPHYQLCFSVRCIKD